MKQAVRAVMIEDYFVHVSPASADDDNRGYIRVVHMDGGAEEIYTVDGLKPFLMKAQDLRIGWAELPDFEVIYVYDRQDGNFGYALNITDDTLSEWGYAPF